MKGDRIITSLLSLQEIPNAEPALLEKLNVPDGYKSLGIVTTDCDDVSYAATRAPATPRRNWPVSSSASWRGRTRRKSGPA